MLDGRYLVYYQSGPVSMEPARRLPPLVHAWRDLATSGELQEGGGCPEGWEVFFSVLCHVAKERALARVVSWAMMTPWGCRAAYDGGPLGPPWGPPRRVRHQSWGCGRGLGGLLGGPPAPPQAAAVRMCRTANPPHRVAVQQLEGTHR